MKVSPIFNTNEITEYFYSITHEAFEHIDFRPNTYFNVPIYRKDMSLENLYHRTGSKLANGTKEQEINKDWHKEVTSIELSNGVLHKVYYDSSNSALPVGSYLHTYIFCYNNWESEGNLYWDVFKKNYPGAKENLWFSYIHEDAGFDWHKDGNFWRYHQVLLNDGVTPSFVTRKMSTYASPGEAFIEWTGDEHCVPKCTRPRLHLVGSFT